MSSMPLYYIYMPCVYIHKVPFGCLELKTTTIKYEVPSSSSSSTGPLTPLELLVMENKAATSVNVTQYSPFPQPALVMSFVVLFI